jgi:hypothetical protein
MLRPLVFIVTLAVQALRAIFCSREKLIDDAKGGMWIISRNMLGDFPEVPFRLIAETKRPHRL